MLKFLGGRLVDVVKTRKNGGFCGGAGFGFYWVSGGALCGPSLCYKNIITCGPLSAPLESCCFSIWSRYLKVVFWRNSVGRSVCFENLGSVGFCLKIVVFVSRE